MKNQKKSVIRRAAALLAAVMMLFPAALSAYADEAPSVILPAERLSGTADIIFNSPSGGDMTVTLDGNPLVTEEIGSLELVFAADGVDYNNSVFRIGDTDIAVVDSNGEKRVPLDASLLPGDTLTLSFLPSIGKTGVLDTSKIYGTYNIDDMSISDVRIALPSGEYVRPSRLVSYYPTTGQAGVSAKESDYSGSKVSVGDGWSAETGLGGTTPNVPVCFDVVFDISGSDLTKRAGRTLRAGVDTEKYADGEHTFAVTASGKSTSVTAIFDNTPPVITGSITSGALIDGKDTVGVSVSDDSGYTLEMRIDGRKYAEGKPVSEFVSKTKTHTFTAVATDGCGNISAFSAEFRINGYSDTTDGDAADGSTVTAGSGTLYLADPLTVSSDGNVFTVPAGGGDSIIFRYSGVTAEGTQIVLSVKNADGFVPFARVNSGETAYPELELKAEYIDGGNVTVRAEEYVYSSESDTIVWISDTQYYTRYEDLLDKYEAALKYYAKLYSEGRAGFFIHTGDVADEYEPAKTIEEQLGRASKLHSRYLDNAGLPNGIVDGNHDVGQSKRDSSYFVKYFGAERYGDSSWFYGDLNNNESHYDLISLGGYDFVLLWLGYGVEAEPETMAWAKDVLGRFKNRNAIILTHSYLDVDGEWVLDPTNPDAYTHSRAPEIWDNLVVPYENVVAVLCGHTPGVARTLRKVDDSRSVWEILADYQFYEDGSEPKHVLNGCSCDGEGFVRLVSFDGSSMTQKTYSPYSGKSNPFGNEKDEFTVPLALRNSSGRGLEGSLEAFAVRSRTKLDGTAVPVSGHYVINAASYSISGGGTESSAASTDIAGVDSDSQFGVPSISGGAVIIIAVVAAAVLTAAVVVIVVRKKKNN